MPRDPLLHVHSDARDLADASLSASQHADVAGVARDRDPELRQRVDQGLLERAQVPVQVHAVPGEVENRVTDELAGAVVGDVAAPLHREHVDPLGPEQVGLAGGPARREHGGMLEQQENVLREPVLEARLGEGALPCERLGVRHDARPDHLNAPSGHSGSLNASSRLPRTAHTLAAPPSTKLATPHTASPARPSRRSIGQAMKPRSNAPTADSAPMTPRCHRLSSQRLRRQPNVAPTARPAMVPARIGSAAPSWESGALTWCSSVRTITRAATMVPPPSPAPHASAPRPIASRAST